MNDWKYDSDTPLNWLYSSQEQQEEQNQVEEKKSGSLQWWNIGTTIIFILIIQYRTSILRFMEKIKYVWMDLQWASEEEDEDDEEEDYDDEDFITVWVTYWKHHVWIPIIRDPIWNIITNSNYFYSTTTTTNSSPAVAVNSTTRHNNHHHRTIKTTSILQQQPLPELEHVEDEKKIEHDHHNLISSPQYNTNIEPAFPSEQQYPPGWLMYHPIHGVITKEQLNDLLYNHNDKQQQQQQ